MLIQVKGDVVKLYGRIWEGDGAYIANQIENLEGSDWLTIRLHTVGGSIVDGDLIGEAIQALKRKVHIIVDGWAASMGALLLTYADKVTIRKNAKIMIHEPQGYARGTAKDFRNVANHLEGSRENFIDALVNKTSKSQKYVSKWLDGDNWFSAKQALKERLVDGIEESVFKDSEMTALQSFKMTAALEVPENLQSTFDLPDALNAKAPTASQEDPTQKTIPNNTDTTKNKAKKMKQELIEAFGLQGVTAESSETAIIAVMQAKITGLEGQVSEGKTKIKALEDKEKANVKTSIANAISTAITAGKIPEAQRATYATIGETSGLQALNNVFEGMPARKSIVGSVVTPNGDAVVGIPEARKEWTWDKWQKEDPEGIEALASGDENEKKAFNTLYKAKFKKDYM